jgi:hypothetical protein
MAFHSECAGIGSAGQTGFFGDPYGLSKVAPPYAQQYRSIS